MIDATDRKILNLLQADGRITNLRLAEAVNLSPTPCLRRVARLEEAGIISGYRAVVDPQALGLSVRALVMLKIANNTRKAAEEFAAGVREISAITECVMTAGKLDYVANVYAASLSGYEEIVKDQIGNLPHLAGMETLFILSDVVKRRPIGL